jgi:hypothetical protein
MTTWKLWHILRNPPYNHPLYRRTLVNRMTSPVRHEPAEYPILNARVLLEMLASMFICSSMFSPIFMLLAFIGLLLLMNGTVYSAIWAIRTSGIIAGSREQQTYDLYCVAPQGALGLNWAICTGFLHRNNRLEQIHGLLRSLLLGTLAIVALIALVLLSNAAQTQISTFARQEVQQASIMLINVVTVLALVYIDHVQSVGLGCVLSMVIPTYARGRIDAQIATVAIYLLLQITTYLLTWWFILGLLPDWFSRVDGWIAPIILAALQVITFYSIREAMIALLWSHLLRRLDVASDEEEKLPPSPTFKLGLRPR